MKTTRDGFDPADWNEFEGQEVIKDRLDIAVRRALHKKERLAHVLLDGPAGGGKSTMGALLAARMEEPLVVVSEALTVRKLRDLLYEYELGAVFLLDEIHTYPKATRNAMLPLLEAGWFEGVWFPYCTMVAATTEPEQLLKPFIERFIHCRYIDYTDDEMVNIARRMATCVDLSLPDSTIRQLAIAAGGVPRVARNFITAAEDLASCGRRVTVETILAYEQRETDGLSADHIAYLRILNENHGRAGLEQLTSRLRKHRSIVTSLERLLQDRKLIFLATDGRTITQAGRQRLMQAAA